METEAQEFFGIGAVASRTGLTTPNIRMWEKRYGAVVPDRTDSNRRRYSAEDVERLVIMKQLTNRGHAISNIARLSLHQLTERLGREVPSSGQSSPAAKSRLITIGPSPAFLAEEEDFLNGVVVSHYEDLESATADSGVPLVDLLVMETETLFPETVTLIRNLVNRAGDVPAILLYRFSTSKTATALARAIDGMTLLKAPANDRQLRRECLLKLGHTTPTSNTINVDESSPIPGRLYDQLQLAKLTRISTTVDCECPQHLAGLLQSLTAFEKYSSECEDRNPDDAVLHAFLHRTTATVRRTLEEALDHIVKTEGIKLD